MCTEVNIITFVQQILHFFYYFRFFCPFCVGCVSQLLILLFCFASILYYMDQQYKTFLFLNINYEYYNQVFDFIFLQYKKHIAFDKTLLPTQPYIFRLIIFLINLFLQSHLIKYTIIFQNIKYFYIYWSTVFINSFIFFTFILIKHIYS